MKKVLAIWLATGLTACVHDRGPVGTGPVWDSVEITPEQLRRPGVELTGDNELRILIYANAITDLVVSKVNRQYSPVIALDVTAAERALYRVPALPKPCRLYIGTGRIYKDPSGDYRGRPAGRAAMLVQIRSLRVEGDGAEAQVAELPSDHGGMLVHYSLVKRGGHWRIAEANATTAW